MHRSSPFSRFVIGSLWLTIFFTPYSVEAALRNYIGVPSPPFDFQRSAPPEPDGWPGNEAPPFYYVEEHHPQATDDQVYGTPNKPRRSIPRILSEGSVVVLVGRYDVDHSAGITANGSAEQPVFILRSSSRAPAVFTKKWNVAGSYFFLEGLEGQWFEGNGKLNVAGNHGVVRKGIFYGNRSKVGLGSVNVSGNYMVLYGNEVFDSGLFETSVDADTHGTQIGANSSYIWVMDSVYHHNSGDGIQINAGSREAQSSTHHIYIAGNRFFENRQTGAWTKQAEHVIFSENESYKHITRAGGGGIGLGGQYGPEYVWFIANRIYDNAGGIRLSSDSDLGYGKRHFIIGNVIYRNKNSANFDSNNPWATSAISIWGGESTFVVNNTMFDNFGGIYSPRGSGVLKVVNNIFAASELGHALNIEFPSIISDSENNLFHHDSKVQIGTQVHDLNSFITDYAIFKNSVTSDDAHFTNPLSHDFTLQEGSPAINAGTANDDDAFLIFQSLYGLDIRQDIAGHNRPAEGHWDIGAYEYGSALRPEPPIELQ